MVDVLGAVIIVSAFVYTFTIYAGYAVLEDFNGVVAGVIVATAIMYFLRNLIAGFLTGVV